MFNIIRNSKGYTLVELMGVVTIAGLLLALAAPSYNGLATQDRLELTAHQLASDIRATQQLALAEETGHKITFYPGSNKYMISQRLTVIKTVYTPPGVSLELVNFNNNALNLGDAGLAASGGTITLRSGTKFRYVIVAVNSSRVRVDDKPPGKDLVI